MPGFNQTGPMGQGPKTGRQMGKCGNKDIAVTSQSPFRNRKRISEDETFEFTGRGKRHTHNNWGQTPGKGRGMGKGRRNGMNNFN